VKRLDLHHNSDRGAKKSEYRVLNTATAASFTPDGLEIAIIAGGDLWVMDTELREPRQITRTAEEEANPIMLPDGQAIYFVGPLPGGFAIFKATRKDAKKYWWQNREFDVIPAISSADRPTKLKLSPDGKKLAYVKGLRGLFVMDLATGADERVIADWSVPDYDWSPDGKWFVYAKLDEDFNRDVWILPSDGKGKPYNLSRHPFGEHDPVWSPDGKMIAYAGRRSSGEPGSHICVVYLNPDDDEKTARDRKLDKALDKMKGRTPGAGKELPKMTPAANVTVDFDRLHDRVKRVSLGEGAASTLFWSPDSKKLAFTGTYAGKLGTYAIDIGDTLTPKAFVTPTGGNPVWLKSGNQIVWLVGGVPTSTPGVAAAAPATTPTPQPTQPVIPKKGGGGKGLGKGGFGGGPPAATGGGYSFTVRQLVDLPARNAAIFDTCWVLMRDHWYDAKLGNNNWDAIRSKYRPMAAAAPDPETVQTCVQMMLGELNGSHRRRRRAIRRHTSVSDSMRRSMARA
jgi:tricorn protease